MSTVLLIASVDHSMFNPPSHSYFFVNSDLIESMCVRDHVTPNVVRQHFKDQRLGISHPSVDYSHLLSPSLAADGVQNANQEAILCKKSNAAFILAYCISDVHNALCGPNTPQADDAAQLLFGLPLLPTEVSRMFCFFIIIFAG